MLSFPEMKRQRALKGHTANVMAVAMDKQERWIATAGGDAVACLWDTQVGARRAGGRVWCAGLRLHLLVASRAPLPCPAWRTSTHPVGVAGCRTTSASGPT